MKQHDVLVLGAGVSGIYQLKRLLDLGLDVAMLEADDDLGGTWYRNRYPGCRFDSESYTYGYSFSQEVLDEWHWKERFSGQPENLRYLNFVADKFELRPHMRFNARVEAMKWHEEDQRWELQLADGERYSARFVITAMGVLSVPTMPSYPGMDTFKGHAFHTYWWPDEPIDLAGKRVGVIGTGATGIQVIAEIADKVGELHVFQRRPNWSTPLHNSPISETEMAAIRARYDEIFANCAASPNGFEHVPDRRGFWNLSPEARKETWDTLYGTPGFALLAGNFPEIFLDQEANQEVSDYVASRIRARVDDPDIAEKLIPKDHGFGTQRLPLETNYFEAYNRDNVTLVDLSETPIEAVTEDGIQTSSTHVDLDIIVYATGFDAITGAFDQIDIEGRDGIRLRDKWRDSPHTLMGLMTSGFPNLLMIAGPQSVSGSTNFPRAIEVCVDWVTDFLQTVFAKDVATFEAEAQAEATWGEEIRTAHDRLLSRHAKGWFSGYNENIDGRVNTKPRYHAYFGGGPRYVAKLNDLAANDYPGVAFARRA